MKEIIIGLVLTMWFIMLISLSIGAVFSKKVYEKILLILFIILYSASISTLITLILTETL